MLAAASENEIIRRVRSRAVKGGMTRKPKVTSGPAVITPREIVTPMAR